MLTTGSPSKVVWVSSGVAIIEHAETARLTKMSNSSSRQRGIFCVTNGFIKNLPWHNSPLYESLENRGFSDCFEIIRLIITWHVASVSGKGRGAGFANGK